jgi:rhodanese-related sulfurtransferase
MTFVKIQNNMSNLFKHLFGKPHDLKTLHLNGAIILDVRSAGEFRAGHIPGAVNVPLDRLKTAVYDLKKQQKPVITCCLSGARSAMALKILSQAGLEVYNGGSWQALENAIR